MSGRISHRLNKALGRLMPERLVFLRSDTETRFLRLTPSAQVMVLAGSALLIGWAILATSIMVVGTLSAGDAHQQSILEQGIFQGRLKALTQAREAHTAEIASASQRFETALGQVSQMQTELLASEDHRKELQTDIDVVQQILRRAIRQRDAARDEAERLRHKLTRVSGASYTTAGRDEDAAATLDAISAELSKTASARDEAVARHAAAEAAAAHAQRGAKLIEQRNALLFAQLDSAVTAAAAPMGTMFKSIGLDPKRVVAEMRASYDAGSGGVLSPLTLKPHDAQGAHDVSAANRLLESLRALNDYRLAEEHLPLGLPLKTRFVYTSPFGPRTDPFTGRSNFHPGIDMASAYGTPIYATGEGVVIHAGWISGYGREVLIQHAFGVKSLYGHMSQVRVKVGEHVTRGQRIGDMGSSGRSTGTHLHYEIRIGNRHVDPVPYIRALAAPSQGRRVADFEIHREGRIVK